MATKQLLALVRDEDSNVRRLTAYTLGEAFPHITDKDKVIKQLLSLTTKDDILGNIAEDVLRMIVTQTAYAIKSAQVHDEEQVIKYLLEFTKNKSSFVHSEEGVDSGLTQEADTEKMWKSLISHVKDEDMMESWGATKSLGIAFAKMPDKERTLKDLFALLKDEDIFVRANGVNALNEVFTPFSKNRVSKIEIACDRCGSVTKHECKASYTEINYKCGNIVVRGVILD